MARWQRFWLVGTLAYVTPLALLIAAYGPYQTPWNAVVVLGPPAVAYAVAWAASR
jgi:hypothetical protein